MAGILTMPDLTPIVYVVDDDISVRECLEGLIYEAGWQPSVFASAQEFLSHRRTLCPSCLVLDVVLPGLSGLDLQQQIAGDRANIPIIFITGHGDVPIAVRAMKAGAFEFLTKPFSEEMLLEAIRSALGRSKATQGAASEIKTLQERYASLSGREREVMGLVVSGLMNKQVGGELGISEITVKAHRGRVMQKMKAGSLAELVKFATKLDIPRGGLCRPMSMQTANLQKIAAPSRNHAIRCRWQVPREMGTF
jgi:FixJ family two-component response regulator